jgi:hypothetical protein
MENCYLMSAFANAAASDTPADVTPSRYRLAIWRRTSRRPLAVKRSCSVSSTYPHERDCYMGTVFGNPPLFHFAVKKKIQHNYIIIQASFLEGIFTGFNRPHPPSYFLHIGEELYSQQAYSILSVNFVLKWQRRVTSIPIQHKRS